MMTVTKYYSITITAEILKKISKVYAPPEAAIDEDQEGYLISTKYLNILCLHLTLAVNNLLKSLVELE